MGFEEENPVQVRKNIKIENGLMISKVNGKRYEIGKLQIVSPEELKTEVKPLKFYGSRIKVSAIVGDVQELHKMPGNKGALFQVASQFNLLEMTGPEITPEAGVGIYEYDHTQGPACAIACGAGTIYRNYFVDVNGQLGQSAENQIDCLSRFGKALGNDVHNFWRMSNGYVLSTEENLVKMNKVLDSLTEEEYELLKGKVEVGIQWNTEVTVSEDKNIVSQIYCSALPVSYSDVEANLWEKFARLILEATYEATFYAALKNYERNGNSKLFLTLVGGGAFGNKKEWIYDAIGSAVEKFSTVPLDVKIVTRREPSVTLTQFIENTNRKLGS